MAKNLSKSKIIVILGKRTSGKTTVAEMLHRLLSNTNLITMQAYAIQAFIDTHEITLDEFQNSHLYTENRQFLGVFIEHQRKKKKDVFLTPILDYINKTDQVIIEDVFFYNEVSALHSLDATFIWVDTDEKYRSNRYYTQYLVGKPEYKNKQQSNFAPYLDNGPLEIEISKLNPSLIKYWSNIHTVTNNHDMDTLRNNLRLLI